MFQFLFVALLATLTLFSPTESLQWPDYLERCSVKSPGLNECIKKNLQLTYEEHSDGIPELNIAPFDPKLVPELLFEYSRNGVEGKMALRNVKAYGVKNMRILDVRADLSDPSNMTFDIDYKIPSMFMEGEYKVEGMISNVPIRSKGVYNVTVSDIRGTFNMECYLVKNNGEDYMKVRHLYMYPDFGDVKLHSSNFFPWSPELSKAALQFTNNYWPLFYKELRPYAIEGWDKFGTLHLNKIFLNIPFKTMFSVDK